MADRYFSQLRDHLGEVFRQVEKVQEIKLEKTKWLNDRYIKASSFKEGCLVLKNVVTIKPGLSKKLALRWDGPFVIIKRINEQSYQVGLAKNPMARTRVVHHNRLKMFFGDIEHYSVGQEKELAIADQNNKPEKNQMDRAPQRKRGRKPKSHYPTEDGGISPVTQDLDQLAEKIDWEMKVKNLCPLEDEHESNILDLSAIDLNKLRFDKSVTNSNVHEIFIKSILTVEDCEIPFCKALRHHAYKFDLGNIALKKVMSQPKSQSITIAFVRFEQAALHPQIVQSLDGAS
ncbi:Transposon Ty3-I Gag-Pol poly [Brachionus plicatilis]|uniref:Transposon Ty3-I Gag-Pol poly n=1 Tax=Brachionus plicatilis TaxID=10195 RepID=A0A3M7QA45_BRAPC|nr:Transposon Ty3-I Gag-Pol poly [Brachionus plicatilis]